MVIVIDNKTGLSASKYEAGVRKILPIGEPEEVIPPTPEKPVKPGNPSDQILLGPISIREEISPELGYLTIYGTGVVVFIDDKEQTEIRQDAVTKLEYTSTQPQTTVLNLISAETGEKMPVRYSNNHIQYYINGSFQNLVGSKTLGELVGGKKQEKGDEGQILTKNLIFKATKQGLYLARKMPLTKNVVAGLDDNEYVLNYYGVKGEKYTLQTEFENFRVGGYQIRTRCTSQYTLAVDDLILMYHDDSIVRTEIQNMLTGQVLVVNNLPIDIVKDAGVIYTMSRVGNDVIPIPEIAMTEATLVQYDPSVRDKLLPYFGSEEEKKKFFDAWVRIQVPTKPIINLVRPPEIPADIWAKLSDAEKLFLLKNETFKGTKQLKTIAEMFVNPYPGVHINVWNQLTPEEKWAAHNGGDVTALLARNEEYLAEEKAKKDAGVPSGDMLGSIDHSKLRNIQTYLLTHPNRGQSTVIKQTPIFEPRELTSVDLSMLHAKSEKSFLQQTGGAIIFMMLGGIAWAYYAKNKDQFDLDPFQKEVLDIEKTDRELTVKSNEQQNEAIRKYQDGVAGLQSAAALNQEEAQSHGVLGQALRKATKSVIDNTTMNYAEKITNKLSGKKSEEEKEEIRRAQNREDLLFQSNLRGTEEERRHKMALEARRESSKLFEERLESTAERQERLRKQRQAEKLEEDTTAEIPEPLPPFEPVYPDTVDEPIDITDKLRQDLEREQYAKELSEVLAAKPAVAEVPEEVKEEVITEALPEAKILDFPEIPEYPPVEEKEEELLVPEEKEKKDEVNERSLISTVSSSIYRFANKKYKRRGPRDIMAEGIIKQLTRLKNAGVAQDELNKLVSYFNVVRTTQYLMPPITEGDY